MNVVTITVEISTATDVLIISVVALAAAVVIACVDT